MQDPPRLKRFATQQDRLKIKENYAELRAASLTHR